MSKILVMDVSYVYFLKLKNGVCIWLQTGILHDNCLAKSLTAMLDTHGVYEIQNYKYNVKLPADYVVGFVQPVNYMCCPDV